MIIISLLFSFVLLVSFDSLSTAVIASGSWALLTIALFSTSVI